MQNPTDPAEASIPTETARESPNLNRTFTVRRKAAKRSERWYQITATPLPPSPQGGDIPARKKPRLDEPIPTATDEVAKKTASPESSVGLLPPTTDTDDANADHVTDTQLNAGATGATGRWTTGEDVKLISAVANTRKKKSAKGYLRDWVAIAALIPGRTNLQCCDRWNRALDPRIALTAGSTGRWGEDEDIKLKAAVQRHGGKGWAAVAVMVPGRTKMQCRNRWDCVLNPSIALTAGRMGIWTADEDLRLKNSVQGHGGRNWVLIATLVPGRTKVQCYNRWRNVLDPQRTKISS
jgi:hypothetical protein